MSDAPLSPTPPLSTINPLESKDVELSNLHTSQPSTSGNNTSQPSTSGNNSFKSSRHKKRLSVVDFNLSAQVPDTDFSQGKQLVNVDTVLELCALKFRDAVSGRFRAYRLQRQAISWYLMYHKSWYRWTLMIITLLHLSLVMFETPSSINLIPIKWGTSDSVNSIPVRHFMLHNKTMYVGENYQQWVPFTSVLEFIFVSFHWIDIYVQYNLSGGESCRVACDHGWYTIKLVVISLMSINSIFSLILLFGANEHPFNFMRMLRPLLLVNEEIIFFVLLRARTVPGVLFSNNSNRCP